MTIGRSIFNGLSYGLNKVAPFVAIASIGGKFPGNAFTPTYKLMDILTGTLYRSGTATFVKTVGVVSEFLNNVKDHVWVETDLSIC